MGDFVIDIRFDRLYKIALPAKKSGFVNKN